MQIVFSKNTSTHLYQVNSSKLQQMSFYGDLYEMLRRIGKEQLSEYVFLLDETYFQFVSCTVLLHVDVPVSHAKIKRLVQEKIEQLQTQQGLRSPYIRHFISDIQVNGDASQFILGKQGKIEFQLHLYYLAPDAVTSFEVVTGRNKLLAQDLTIMPKSFYTAQYLREKIVRPTFRLLYIREDSCHLIHIQKGSYQGFYQMRLGLQLLKGSYEEHDILNYYYHSTEELNANEFLRKLVTEANEFYTDMLCKWLKQYVPSDQEVILISDIVQNAFFIDSLQKSYRESVNGYLLPISSIHSTISQTYKPHELDVVTCYQSLSHNEKADTTI